MHVKALAHVVLGSPITILLMLFIACFSAYYGLVIFSSIWLSSMSDDARFKQGVQVMALDAAILNAMNSSGFAAQQAQTSAIMQNYSDTRDALFALRDWYLWWYLGFDGFMALCVAAFSLTYTLMNASASRRIHIAMLGMCLL